MVGKLGGMAEPELKGSKIALLLRLLAAVDEGRYSFDDLRRHLDPENPPAARTLRRYLSELAAAGFPWFYDREAGVYRFEHGYSLRKLELSNDELFGLLALKGIASSLGGNIGASIEGIARRLTRVSGSSSAKSAQPTVRVQIADPHLDPERDAIFRAMQRAQLDRQSVRFSYVDKRRRSSKRHVDPYGFVVSSGRVYLVAHDRGRGAKRVFALDAIANARVSPQRFTMPADFDIEAFAARSVSGIMHGEGALRVTVRFTSVVARAAVADRVVRERTIDERDDGSVEIAYTVGDADEFVRWTMKWGAEAEILGPPEVRANAAALAREML
jgi:proteasome accessory factor B